MSNRYYVVKKKDSGSDPNKYLDRRRDTWTPLSPDTLHKTRTDADHGAEDGSHRGPDPSRPQPVKVVPVKIVEDE